MSKRSLFVLFVFAALVGVLALRIASAWGERPAPPPAGTVQAYPWGAIDLGEDPSAPDSALEMTLRASFRAEGEGAFDPDEDGVREYDILILSGGGSAGAFGSGFLNGWTASGTRHDFKVVTGVSTGSLQCTFAFLGPEYDDELKEVFTGVETRDIYEERGLLHALFGDAAMDSAPLARLIEKNIDDAVLEAVAAKHARGGRLFVGTSNMDTDELVIWDMGAIASSDRTDKLEHYRKVLLASCSIPVLFPPVYLPIEVDGSTYHEMHMDGGARSQLFLRGFMLDFEDALEVEGIGGTTFETSLYIIRNGQANDAPTRQTVDPSLVSIATEMINGVFDLSTDASLYRIYVLANRYGVDFNLAALSDDVEPDLDPVIFDAAQMRRIYDWAYAAAASGYEWRKSPSGLDRDELLPVRDGR